MPENPRRPAARSCGRRLNLLFRYIGPGAAVLAALLAGRVPLLGAQDGEGTRVGVIDLARAVEGVRDFQTAAETWTAEMQRRTAEIQAKRAEIDEVQERLNSQQEALNGSTRSTLIAQVEDLQIEVERMEQDVQADMNALREQLLLPITEKVDRAIVSHAEEEGISIVIDISNPVLGLTVASDADDITDAVIARVDSEAEAGP